MQLPDREGIRPTDDVKMTALMANQDIHRGVSRGLRVLVVEDDPNSRWVLCALMRRLGYNCQVATNGEEALQMVESFAPQVILMDLMMPVLDGLEATRRLKADAKTRGIPVLALTGNVTPAGESAARMAGCSRAHERSRR